MRENQVISQRIPILLPCPSGACGESRLPVSEEIVSRTIRETSSGQTLFVQSWLPCLCDQLLYSGLLFLGQFRIQPQ